jgi:CRISPR type I-E-associated protein CasB/Cse2
MTEASDYRFVGYLESLRDHGNRAALAALRRALGKEPGSAPEAYPIVMPYVPEYASERVERIYFLVGALFALHQKSWARAEADTSAHDFGASMRILADRRPGGGPERRFAALLACSETELGEHLRHAVGLLKSDDVAIDWMGLLSDLRGWNYERHPTQRRWARSFWAGRMASGIEVGTAGGNSRE